MEDLLLFQEELAKKYHYRKLNKNLSNEVRKKYIDNLPLWCKIEGDIDCSLYDNKRIRISDGYNRIVIGDYGAFIEFDCVLAKVKNFILKSGEEYRAYDYKYKAGTKYVWMTTKNDSGIKIYFQQRKVEYADYKPNYFYVSPYEVLVERK